MPGINLKVIPKGKDHFLNRDHDLTKGASGKISPPDGSGKEGIPGEKEILHQQADPSPGVARGGDDLEADASQFDPVPVAEKPVCRGRIVCGETEGSGLFTGDSEERGILFMDQDIGACGLFEFPIGAYVVEMSMRVEDIFQR